METENRIIIENAEFTRAEYSEKPPVAVSGRSFCSLTLRLSGRITITSENETFVSKPGTLTLVPAGCPYITEITESGEMLILHFTLLSGKFAFPLSIKPEYPRLYQSLFLQAIDISRTDMSGLAVMASAYGILSELVSELSIKEAHPPRRMRDIREYIDENFCDPSLRIGLLAEKCGMSEVWFRREFRKYYGASPLAYIKSKRIGRAKQLLMTGLYGVTEVALSCGFDGINYFSDEFRRITGMSPKQYSESV